MVALLTQHFMWAFLSVQVVGLLSALLARLNGRRANAFSWQAIFFAALVAVGLITAHAASQGLDLWPMAAGTFATMVVMAVWDPGAGRSDLGFEI